MNVIQFPIKNNNPKKYYDEIYMRKRFESKLKEFSEQKYEFLNWIEEIEKEAIEALKNSDPLCYSAELFDEYLKDFDFRRMAIYHLNTPFFQERKG